MRFSLSISGSCQNISTTVCLFILYPNGRLHVSLLMRNRSRSFSVERLQDSLTALGQDVEISVRPARQGSRRSFRHVIDLLAAWTGEAPVSPLMVLLTGETSSARFELPDAPLPSANGVGVLRLRRNFTS
jgi:hypothetical protein